MLKMRKRPQFAWNCQLFSGLVIIFQTFGNVRAADRPGNKTYIDSPIYETDAQAGEDLENQQNRFSRNTAQINKKKGKKHTYPPKWHICGWIHFLVQMLWQVRIYQPLLWYLTMANEKKMRQWIYISEFNYYYVTLIQQRVLKQDSNLRNQCTLPV